MIIPSTISTGHDIIPLKFPPDMILSLQHFAELLCHLPFTINSFPIDSNTPLPEQLHVYTIRLEMCSVSTNGERASLANLKLTIGSL